MANHKLQLQAIESQTHTFCHSTTHIGTGGTDYKFAVAKLA